MAEMRSAWNADEIRAADDRADRARAEERTAQLEVIELSAGDPKGRFVKTDEKWETAAQALAEVTIATRAGLSFSEIREIMAEGRQKGWKGVPS
jgi:hypothetical protein